MIVIAACEHQGNDEALDDKFNCLYSDLTAEKPRTRNMQLFFRVYDNLTTTLLIQILSHTSWLLLFFRQAITADNHA